MRTRMAFCMARRPALIKGPGKAGLETPRDICAPPPPPSPAIGLAAPSAGGVAASEAGVQWVEAAWNREDVKPISRSALKDV